MFLVNFAKYLHQDEVPAAGNYTDESMNLSSTTFDDLFTLKYYKLEGLGYFLFPAMSISYLTYFGAGGFLHVRSFIFKYFHEVHQYHLKLSFDDIVVLLRAPTRSS